MNIAIMIHDQSHSGISYFVCNNIISVLILSVIVVFLFLFVSVDSELTTLQNTWNFVVDDFKAGTI